MNFKFVKREKKGICSSEYGSWSLWTQLNILANLWGGFGSAGASSKEWIWVAGKNNHEHQNPVKGREQLHFIVLDFGWTLQRTYQDHVLCEGEDTPNPAVSRYSQGWQRGEQGSILKKILRLICVGDLHVVSLKGAFTSYDLTWYAGKGPMVWPRKPGKL